MNKAIIERRISIFDIETPYLFTEKRYDRYLEQLKKFGNMTDVTASGEFVYGTVNNRAAKNIRIEVDSRFVTDESFKNIIDTIFITVK